METFLGILIPFLGTTLGSACVFFMKKSLGDLVQRSLAGFAAGVMVLDVTLHNIPEGMAVGVVYAGFLSGNTQITAASALALSLGIAIQNFPEGAIISMPLRAEGERKGRAFLGGVLSGVVEPIGAFLTQTKLPVEHAFFDGGQFAQIGKGTRRIMTPFLYFAIRSLYWSKGGTLKKVLWCDDDSIKPYFIAAGRKSDLYKFAAAYSGQPGGQALSVPSRRTAKAYLFRVWQHRRSFQIPSGSDGSLPLRPLSRV